MITKELVRKALVHNVMNLEQSPNGDGIVARCGEYWFYFGGSTAEEYQDPDEFWKDMFFEDIVSEIFDVLDEFQHGENETEAAYYEAYINEHLPEGDADKRSSFMEYVEEHFSFANETLALMRNIIEYAQAQGSEEEAQSVLFAILDGFYGISHDELETVL